MPLIEFQDIKKIYPMGETTVRALDGVNLSIEKGEFTAVLGPSGSGKSTLMHILGFMDQPSSGHFRFDGDEVSRASGGKRAWYRSHRIGFVFQAFNLLPRLSVLGNVELPAVYSRLPAKERRARAMASLERVDMTGRANHLPNQLSGGERQRVAIARALINDPPLVLADEPTGNLDSRNVERIMGLFIRLWQAGQTIVVVTHDEEVAGYTRRVIRMRDGKIAQDTLKSS